MSPAIPHLADFQFAQRCLEGDETTVRAFMHDFRGPTLGMLVQRGASMSEAEEIVDGLWSECLVRDGGRDGLLKHYNGECKLQTWLNTVACNELLTMWRKKKVRVKAHTGPLAPDIPGPTTPGRESGSADAPLIALLRAAIEHGFAQCSAEHFVILQLLHADRLRLREIAIMFGCGEPWMSKTAKRAEAQMRETILAYVREQDSLAELQWDDFLELCSVSAPSCFGLE